VATAAAGWLICAALCLIGWFSDINESLSGPIRLATSLYLLANGAKVSLGGVAVSIAPLLLTFGIMACGIGLTRVALRHGFAAKPIGATKQTAGVAGVVAGTYALVTAGVAGTTQLGSAVGALIGGLVVGAVTAVWATAPLFGWTMPWPGATPLWVRALPRAVGAGLGVLAAGGALVVGIALVSSHQRVADLQAGLQPGGLGTAMVAVGQALWAPTLVIWGIAWVLGAGFALGTGTVVSPVAVHLGMLPSIPVLGAVPDVGAPSKAMIAWFVVPVVAGVAAAWVALRAQATQDHLAVQPPNVVMGTLAGGAAGILTGGVATVLAVVSRGDIGQVRLTGLGPMLGAFALLAPAMLGIAGALTGLVVAWLRGRRFYATHVATDQFVDNDPTFRIPKPPPPQEGPT